MLAEEQTDDTMDTTPSANDTTPLPAMPALPPAIVPSVTAYVRCACCGEDFAAGELKIKCSDERCYDTDVFHQDCMTLTLMHEWVCDKHIEEELFGETIEIT